MSDDREADRAAKRQEGLLRVREWFAPAFAPDEVLAAALAANTVRLTMLNSLVGTAKTFAGRSPARVLLLTDRAIHVATRRFWKRRFKGLHVSYPIGAVPITVDGGELRIGDESYFLNPPGDQLRSSIGTTEDVRLFLGAARPE